ncbi:MAG: hypothetical protein IPQ06_12230 [Chitinophagaceae bacterium]|nr:hypothetical protein [Chitinophagaceae bacterium]
MFIKLLRILPRPFFVALLFTFTHQAYTQPVPSGQTEIPVTIKIVNQKKEPVAFASVTLINRMDSTLSISKVADSSGMASFNLIKNNQYTIRINSVNYQLIEKEFQHRENKQFSTIRPIQRAKL